ncbi:MAG: response regulator [Planctomycetaceae bacterium]|nr:response regulator [Planctomycetaceae bacterium]
MITDPSGSLFRVFLLEDDPNLNKDLKWLIERKFPGVSVTEAKCVQDALTLLSSGDRPDVALQDIRVPLLMGGHPETQTAVADRLNELHVPSIFMTGYRSSEDVEEFIRRQRLVDSKATIISKRQMDSLVDRIFSELNDWFGKIASERVTSQLERLFLSSHTAVRSHTGTAELLTLQEDIRRYWNHLTDEARNRVSQFFCVDEDGSQLTLSLDTTDHGV